MIDVKRLQTRLGVTADGIMGRGTWSTLFVRLGASPALAQQLALGANVHCPRFGITDTPLRLAHFLGQTGHESGGFRYMQEIWGPTDAQRRYEGRADLGNVSPGDGKLFAGRGVLQITGRANYRKYGQKLGMDLESHPELVGYPSIGLLCACQYWDDHGLNALADKDNGLAITKAINGGTNGESDRIERTNKAKDLLL